MLLLKIGEADTFTASGSLPQRPQCPPKTSLTTAWFMIVALISGSRTVAVVPSLR
jgi:hypothetical protein